VLARGRVPAMIPFIFLIAAFRGSFYRGNPSRTRASDVP
jgi:hypothetical protein